MRITFVVPAVNLSGGLRVVSIYASYLASQGHQVTIVSPGPRQFSMRDQLKSLVRDRKWLKDTKFNKAFFNDPAVNLIVLDGCKTVDESQVPDSDVVIATLWLTAEWVARFSAKKGKKYYFIQHYEIHPWFPKDRVIATLKMPFERIVVSQWLENILADEYKLPCRLVPNGVDSQKFAFSERSGKEPLRIGFMYAVRDYKGCDIAIAAINKLLSAYADLRIVAFGTSPLPSDSFPEGAQVEFHLNPPQAEIPFIYGSCRAWLFSSRVEGYGLPLLEAMSCGTPLVATRAGAAPELLEKHQEQLIAVDDVDAMVKAATRLFELAPEDWKQLSREMRAIAEGNHWDKVAAQFEQALLPKT